MSMPLERPAPAGDRFDVASHVGALLVIEPLEDVPPMVTKASKDPQPAIRCNVYVIGPPGQVTETFHNTLLFQKLLWQRLRQSLGRRVVGILTGSPGQVVNGRNTPYDLGDPPDAAFQAASRAMAAHAMTAPAAPADDPWAAQQPPAGWPGSAPAQPQPVQPQQGPWQQPAQQPQQAPWGQQQLPQHPVTDQSPWNTPAPQQPPDERPPWEADQPSAPWGQQ